MKDEDVVTLREFILVQLVELEKRMAQWMKAIEQEQARSERERDALRDATMRCVPRPFYDQNHEDLRRRLDLLEQKQANFAGRAFATGAIIGVVLAVAQLIVHYWK